MGKTGGSVASCTTNAKQKRFQTPGKYFQLRGEKTSVSAMSNRRGSCPCPDARLWIQGHIIAPLFWGDSSSAAKDKVQAIGPPGRETRPRRGIGG